ncbi:PspA/IM30 family protein [Collinsella ihumii]|uniref:PspA/IM30 family protein n=1 Tax=Collinsella ihumii TaxID=1720204 RepID=A0AAW7JPD2_9ACTN|nr:PspA/IM30 family protein [Collinsella ihumii]MBM6777442.1 PspA/IM30 family protein [Collinsella tanakaei]MDN0068724.1 PspA/IM30 family protein [Collinsella ihumii]
MGILERFTTIVKANINELLDHAEDPAKMIDQYLVDLTESLAEVKQETAGVIAEEKRCRRMVDDNAAEIARMEDLAKKALAAGNEGDARTFLGKKQQLATAGTELEKAYDAAHANADKMRQMHDKLVSDIENLKSRRETIKAKVAVAKTQEKVAGFTSGSDRAESAIEAFDRMEAKADRMLDTADAMAELNEEPADEVADLEKKYASAVNDAAVDDDLARLKAEMGL